MKALVKYLLCLSLIVIGTQRVSGQDITLSNCIAWAEKMSPLSRQDALFETISMLKQQNANKANLPQLMINGQASYQSDVFVLPFNTPGMESPEIPKDQYKFSITLSQNLYDGGLANINRQLAIIQSEVLQNQKEVSLYQLREIISRLYFNFLFLVERQKAQESVINLLSSQLSEVESSVKNGVILSSNLDIIRKELVQREQHLDALISDKSANLAMLRKWTGQEIPEMDSLKIPDTSDWLTEINVDNRPEINLFKWQQQEYDQQQILLKARRAPKLQLFLQGGIGRPNPYNFFETDLNGFYMAGLKLSWLPVDWGITKNKDQLINKQKEINQIRLDDFKHQLSISIIKDNNDIEKFKRMLERDRELAAIQGRIVTTAYSQLNHGVITSTEYITELNKATQINIDTKIHELQLIQSKINLLIRSGNYNQ